MENLDAFIEDLRRRMERLIQEVKRLRTQNRQLREENKRLREESTMVRIYKNMKERREEFPTPPPSDVDPKAHDLYQQLPKDFRFAEYFDVADEKGLEGEEARVFLLYFIRQGMLEQQGGRVEKRHDQNGTPPGQ